uniref:RGS domain-containing protein n=1 Tax=Oryctolagus cuniculus TaxID=9986 RepID=A0A5F9C7R0_RABIT
MGRRPLGVLLCLIWATLICFKKKKKKKKKKKSLSAAVALIKHGHLMNVFFFFSLRLKDWKTRLSYFLQNSSTPGKPKTGKKSKQQAFIRPSPEEALLWSEAFDELLASKYGLAAFRAFLKSEFCEENIEFWLACEDFKKTKSPQKLSSKARKIYTDFIEKEAPKEINIDFQTKTLIAQRDKLNVSRKEADKEMRSKEEFKGANHRYPRHSLRAALNRRHPSWPA